MSSPTSEQNMSSNVSLSSIFTFMTPMNDSIVTRKQRTTFINNELQRKYL